MHARWGKTDVVQLYALQVRFVRRSALSLSILLIFGMRTLSKVLLVRHGGKRVSEHQSCVCRSQSGAKQPKSCCGRRCPPSAARPSRAVPSKHSQCSGCWPSRPSSALCKAFSTYGCVQSRQFTHCAEHSTSTYCCREQSSWLTLLSFAAASATPVVHSEHVALLMAAPVVAHPSSVLSAKSTVCCFAAAALFKCCVANSDMPRRYLTTCSLSTLPITSTVSDLLYIPVTLFLYELHHCLTATLIIHHLLMQM